MLSAHQSGEVLPVKDLKEALPPQVAAPQSTVYSIDPIWEGSGVSEITTEDSTVVIHVTGVLTKEDYWFTAGSKSILRTLQACENNANIDLVVLSIDGPGGCALAIRELAGYVRNMSTKTVGYIEDMACSAHAQLAAACDVTFANHAMALTGSIGTYLSPMDITGYFEKLGIKTEDIYADESPEKNSTYRAWKDGDSTLIKADLSIWANDFINAMKEMRPNVDTTKRDPYKGATLYASDALEIGLIDGIGSLADAIHHTSHTNTNTDMSFKSILNAIIGKKDNTEHLSPEELAGHNASLKEVKAGAFLVPVTEEIADADAFKDALIEAEKTEQAFADEQAAHTTTKESLKTTETARDEKQGALDGLTALFGDDAKAEGFDMKAAVQVALLDQKKLKDGAAGGTPLGTEASADGDPVPDESEIDLDNLPHNKMADSF